MAKQVKKREPENEGKAWREGELIDSFQLTRIVTHHTPLMQEWLNVQMPEFNLGEQYNFDKSYLKVVKNISGWSEEDLKVKFIGPILELGHIIDDDNDAISYFDKTISATVDGIRLIVKSDFMLAKGILDVVKTPYFHFQEYKPYKNPTGDSMAQLLEAFLIAQEKNKNGKPMYGIDIVGGNWRFVTMEGREYCISQPFTAVDKTDLLTIISVLRKFKYILLTRLMIDS